MNVLPLIHRELLVGSRKRSTFWLRIGVAGAALGLGALMLFSLNQGRFLFGPAGPSPGMAMFYVFTWVGLGTTGLFGVFFAADAISFERREGTLGLLFLTRLRAHDVVLGKLAVTTLRVGFTLLATLPVIALPLLLGGVTFKAYGLVALVLVNTLFLSVATGLAVSSFTRQPTNGVMATLFLLLAVTLLPFWFDALLSDWGQKGNFEFLVSHASPGFALYSAVVRNGAGIWTCLGLQHALAWLFLAFAVWGTSRLSEKVRQGPRKPLGRWVMGTADSRAGRHLRDRAPVQWLTARRSRAPTLVALFLLIVTGAWTAYQAFEEAQQPMGVQMVFMIAAQFNGLFSFALTIWMAAVAARRTGDARRGGALELLLVTPLQDSEIVTGHWRGLCRVFGPAILVVWVVDAITGAVTLSYTYDNAVQQAAQVAQGAATAWSMWDYFWMQAIQFSIGLIRTPLLAAALLWSGLWFGLRLERATAATALTWVLVCLGPAFGQLIIQVFGMGIMFFTGTAAMWMSSLIPGLVGLVIHVAFIIWARRNLLRQFRNVTAGAGKLAPRILRRPPPDPAMPPPLPG